ncbi:hypothetical protein ABT352_33270 [Streptosporangium sp. NPDC000563]|uniref:hypothetical protein n=1 Tax=Streptosporangium sp. NPDC000563 TaxID=3154366 RepID=UPI003324518E
MSVSDAAHVEEPVRGKPPIVSNPIGAVIRRGRMRADYFTQVSNDLARDRRLSRRARGLFVELASHREGWQTSIAKLTEGGPEGVHAIRVAIGELEQYGYLVRVQTRDPKTGRVTGTEYWLTDCPEEYNTSSEPSSENHTTGSDDDSPNSDPSSDFPMADEPTTGEPISADHTPKKKTIPKNTNEKKTNHNLVAPADADASTNAASATPTATSDELGDGLFTPPPSAPKPTARATAAPDDLPVTFEMRAWAKSKGIAVNLDDETEQFLDFHRAKGSKFKDWLAAWRTWMRNTVKFAPGRGSRPGGSPGNHWAGASGSHNPDDPHHEQNRRAFG